MNRVLRKYVFEQLFMCEFYPLQEGPDQLKLLNEDEDLLAEMDSDELSEEERAEMRERAAAINEMRDELDTQIDAVATGWKTHRMGRAELAIIRLALYEMCCDDDVPYKVAINEAVELAKEYGGDDSPAFVNAVLGKLVKELDLTDA